MPKLSPKTVRVGASVSIDLLAGARDDSSSPMSVTLRRFSTKWGAGRLERAPAARVASVFVFAPTSGPGQLKLTYDVRDALNATTTGSIVIRILGEQALLLVVTRLECMRAACAACCCCERMCAAHLHGDRCLDRNPVQQTRLLTSSTPCWRAWWRA